MFKTIQSATGAKYKTLQSIIGADPDLKSGVEMVMARRTRGVPHPLDRMQEMLEDDESQVSFRDFSVAAGIGLDKTMVLSLIKEPTKLNGT